MIPPQHPFRLSRIKRTPPPISLEPPLIHLPNLPRIMKPQQPHRPIIPTRHLHIGFWTYSSFVRYSRGSDEEHFVPCPTFASET